MKLADFNNIHFIGIGGISMSSLAEILHSKGKNVRGSDRCKSETTQKLEEIGVEVIIGQKAENITDDINLVVYTAAIGEDNPELIAARKSNAVVIDRAELVGMLMLSYDHPISIAGTHGKTTTSSLVTEIFLQAGADPTVSIGGMLPSIGGNYKVGGNDYFVLESCEYCDSFLKFNPHSAIILNVDLDHVDYFKNIDNIYKSFHKFAMRVPQDGFLVINNDIPRLAEVIDGVKAEVVTYGSDSSADWYPQDISYNSSGCAAYSVMHKGQKIADVKINVPGEHNVCNSLSAFALAYKYGIATEDIISGMANYTGTNRRFQHKGSYRGITVVDDYAHHPAEIAATIKAARNTAIKELWILFQPHTYTRTKALLDDFAAVLSKADKVIVADIYASREKDTGLVSSKDLANRIDGAVYGGSLAQCESYIRDNCPNGVLLITMGAGDVVKVGESLVSEN